VARIVDRPKERVPTSPAEGCDSAFADIDANELDRARRDPAVKRFAGMADRYFAALKRSLR
jgi:hypothetical protein